MPHELSIVDFEPEHFRRMRLRREDAADIAGLDRDALIASWQGGRTVLRGDEPAMIYGFTEQAGTVVIWSVTSPIIRGLPLFITRLTREFIRGVFRAGAHRVEAWCHVGNARSLLWLTRCLGFQVEGLARRCGPNKQDRFLLSIINKEEE